MNDFDAADWWCGDRQRALDFLKMIQDMANDVRQFDGRELTGRLVAEIHATLAAMISTLARALHDVIEQVA